MAQRGGEREGKERVTCLVFGIGREIFAVVMCGQDDTPRRIWVFRRDDVREVFWAVGRRAYEGVLFYVPVELAKRGGDVVADEGVVFGVGCNRSAGFLQNGKWGQEWISRTRSGDQDLLEVGRNVGWVEVL